jgi:hypothetical protein
VSQEQILGPLFFEEKITAENCTHLLTEFIALLENNVHDCWSQQSGVTAHTVKTTAFLLNFFDDHIAQHGLAIMIPRPYAT